jgi:thiol-disulfide isomerase/thioredoxin
MSRTYFGMLVGLASVGLFVSSAAAAGGVAPASSTGSGGIAQAWEATKEALATSPEDPQLIRRAQSIVQRLERDPENSDVALAAYRDLAQIFRQTENPKLISMAGHYDAAIRRLSLPGHAMKIGGKLIDGSTFDARQLKGKVVLVDFWATWCGPCCAELPNVKRAYQKYHDAGFEVVGVSLDTDMDTLNEFLAARQIPWSILVGGTEAGRGFDQPLAAYYGVSSIPTAILIDQNGRVISLDARGAELSRLLETIFGG